MGLVDAGKMSCLLTMQMVVLPVFAGDAVSTQIKY
jgi:hypothetical protein